MIKNKYMANRTVVTSEGELTFDHEGKAKGSAKIEELVATLPNMAKVAEKKSVAKTTTKTTPKAKTAPSTVKTAKKANPKTTK